MSRPAEATFQRRDGSARTQHRLQNLYREPTADRLKSLQFQANGAADLTHMPFQNDDNWGSKQPGNLYDLGEHAFLKDFEAHELQGIESMRRARDEFEHLPAVWRRYIH